MVLGITPSTKFVYSLGLLEIGVYFLPYLKMSICADVLDIYQEIIEKE